MTVKQAAKKWGISPERVRQYIRTGRILAAKKFGYEIPNDQQKPSPIMPGPKPKRAE